LRWICDVRAIVGRWTQYLVLRSAIMLSLRPMNSNKHRMAAVLSSSSEVIGLTCYGRRYMSWEGTSVLPTVVRLRLKKLVLCELG